MTDKMITVNSPEVQYLCEKDRRLSKLIYMVGDIQLHSHDDNVYAFLVHEIVEQMLSAKAGQRIYSRLEQLCDGDITPEKITSLSDEQIRSTGTSNMKVGYIRSVTEAIQSKTLDENKFAQMTDEEIIKEMTKIRGVGKWTAKMFLIFVLNRPDVLPVEDGAFLQGYRWLFDTNNDSPQDVIEKCYCWRPFSSIAARFLYRAVDGGFIKTKFEVIEKELEES